MIQLFTNAAVISGKIEKIETKKVGGFDRTSATLRVARPNGGATSYLYEYLHINGMAFPFKNVKDGDYVTVSGKYVVTASTPKPDVNEGKPVYYHQINVDSIMVAQPNGLNLGDTTDLEILANTFVLDAVIVSVGEEKISTNGIKSKLLNVRCPLPYGSNGERKGSFFANVRIVSTVAGYDQLQDGQVVQFVGPFDVNYDKESGKTYRAIRAINISFVKHVVESNPLPAQSVAPQPHAQTPQAAQQPVAPQQPQTVGQPQAQAAPQQAAGEVDPFAGIDGEEALDAFFDTGV